jgi:hypothetical protein
MSLRADGPIFQWQVIVNETAVTEHQYVAAALTLSLSLDGQGEGSEMGRETESKKSQTLGMTLQQRFCTDRAVVRLIRSAILLPAF